MWTQTATGRKFVLLNARPSDVNIVDIAWGLRQPRYNNATRRPIYVAGHSVRMSYLFEDRNLARQALLHDAHEAYVGDITEPVARALRFLLGIPEGDAKCPIRRLKQKVQSVVNLRFGLPMMYDPAIHEAAMRMLLTERRDLFHTPPAPWDIDKLDYEPYPEVIEPTALETAPFEFLERFAELWPDECYDRELGQLDEGLWASSVPSTST